MKIKVKIKQVAKSWHLYLIHSSVMGVGYGLLVYFLNFQLDPIESGLFFGAGWLMIDIVFDLVFLNKRK